MDVALGVQSDGLAGVRVGEAGLDGLGFGVGERELAEAEAEDAGAAEAAGGFGTGDRADQRGSLGDGKGVIGVVDGFGDDGLDGLAGL